MTSDGGECFEENRRERGGGTAVRGPSARRQRWTEPRAEGLEGISIPEEQGQWEEQVQRPRPGISGRVRETGAGSKWSEQRAVGWAGQTLI